MDLRKIKVKDLNPLHSPEVSGKRPKLEKLTDDELLEAVNNPFDGQHLKINEQSKVVDGNGRAYELLRRASGRSSKISEETEVYYEPYASIGKDLFPDF